MRLPSFGAFISSQASTIRTLNEKRVADPEAEFEPKLIE
jgi:hypothetical protein